MMSPSRQSSGAVRRSPNAIQLAFFDDPLVRFIGIFNPVLVVIAFGWQEMRDLINAVGTATTEGSGRKADRLTDFEFVLVHRTLHHVQRDCAPPLQWNRTISIVSFKGNTTITKLPRGRFQRAPFRGLCRFASWPSVVPGAGRITNITTARVIKTNHTTPVVDLMVEKIPFAAPFAADFTKRWIRDLARYREPRHCRSIFEIAVTLVPFAALWALAMAAVHFGYWQLSFLLAIPAAGFLVRLFMIQHDCGHGSFFRHRLANDWVGRFLSVLTLTPYDDWRRAHAIHHANSGHLDRRGIGDIDTLTVREFQALAFWGRLRYRLYRHPVVMFGLGAAYQFLLRHRLPIDSNRRGWRAWVSAMATNLAIAAVVITLVWFVGVGPFLLVHLPIALLAGSVGVWLFYVQHQFEETFWAHGGEWSCPETSLSASSFPDVTGVLRWLTANIRVHPVPDVTSGIA